MNKLTLLTCVHTTLFLSTAYATDTSKSSDSTELNKLILSSWSLDGSASIGKTTQEKSTVIISSERVDKGPQNNANSVVGAQNTLIGKTIEYNDHVSDISSITTNPGDGFHSDSSSISSMGTDSSVYQSTPTREDKYRKMVSEKGKKWKEDNGYIFSTIFNSFKSLIAELQKTADVTKNNQYRQKIENAIYLLKGFKYNSELQCDLYEAFLEGRVEKNEDEMLTENNLRKKIDQLKTEIKKDIDHCKNVVKDVKLNRVDAKQIDPILINFSTMKWALTTAPMVQFQKGANFGR